MAVGDNAVRLSFLASCTESIHECSPPSAAAATARALVPPRVDGSDTHALAAPRLWLGTFPHTGRNIVVVGDSINRFVFWALVRSLGEATPMAHNTTVEKHSDFSFDAEDGSGTHISFLWAPEVEDLNTRVRMRYVGGSGSCGKVCTGGCTLRFPDDIGILSPEV